MTLQPLATTTVGSFPRPLWLADTQRSQAHYKLSGEALSQAMDDATVLVLRQQEQLGLDIATDGEMRRQSFIFHVVGNWLGVDTRQLGRTTRYRNRDVDRMVPRIAGRIVHQAGTTSDEIRFAKRNTTLPLKVAVPGPMTVVDSTVNDFYKDEAEQAMDIAAALNQELLEMQAAGCDVLQIDEPAMTRYHDKVKSHGVKALDRCLEGIHIPAIVHLCYGYPGGVSLQHQYGYDRLLPLLMQSAISGFTVEFGRSAFDPGVLRDCAGRIIMCGCIDPGDSPAPSVRSVVDRIEQALKVVDPARMWLAPDCGLMTITRDLAYEKLRVMVEASKTIRARL